MNKPKNCHRCGKHVKNARHMSWNYNTCPQCDSKTRVNLTSDNFDELDTTTEISVVHPVTAYLNQYTRYEMRNIIKRDKFHE